MDIPTWVTDAVFYQIFPDRFARSKRMPERAFEAWDSPPTIHGFKGGDLYGVAERLDYLEDLGITALYLNPVFASASNHRYHTYDYFNVDPLLGGNAALRELLDQAHRRGMRVVLDGVFNHAGRGLWQFHHVLETGSASPYQDWFVFDPEYLAGRKHWGAYPSPEQEKTLQREDSLTAIGYRSWWNLPALPKFNTESSAVREFLFSVAEHWIRFGIDGWRLDVPGEIDDDAFWQEFRRRVRVLNPEAYLVGEIWHEAQRWLQGDQFDGVMNYQLTAACLGFFTGSHLNLDLVNRAGGLRGRVHPMDAHRFADELDRLQGLYPPEINRAQFNLLDSHDMPRFLTCAGGDLNSLKLALILLFTYPGAPCVFYGDEVGMAGGQDPECRQTFPWDENKWDRDLRGYVKNLISLRKSHKALRQGQYERLTSADGVYTYKCTAGEEVVLVALNTAEAARVIDLVSPIKRRGRAQILFGLAEFESISVNLKLTIPARSGVVLKI